MSDTENQLQHALQAVIEAAGVARQLQRELGPSTRMQKSDKSPVTVADFAAQAIVSLELREALGEVRIVGEERRADLADDDGGEALRSAVIDGVQRLRPNIEAEQVLDAVAAAEHDGSSDRFWTLDPIDGTKGFLRGGQYAVALALIEDGQVKIGVMACPELAATAAPGGRPSKTVGAVFGAVAGQGAREYALDAPSTASLRIGVDPSPATAPIRVCESYESAHSNREQLDRLLDQLDRPVEPQRLDSQTKYGVVARGEADLYLRLPRGGDYHEKIWDHAAGSLIAREAGARVSDLSGAPLDFSNGRYLANPPGIVCCVPELHAPLLEAAAKLGLG